MKKQYIYPTTSVESVVMELSILRISPDNRSDMTDIPTDEQW